MENPSHVQASVFDLIGQSGPMVQAVLLLLLAASVFCWAIILIKMRAFKLAYQENQSFLELFWKSKSLEDVSGKAEKYKFSPVASVFRSGHKELKKLSATERSNHGQEEVENVQRSLARASNNEVAQLEKHLSWLATTASAAPFVGLFGTVWGIINSFQNIGATGAANLAVVAPGISEALVATAVGLAAAIPAVVAYNHFLHKIKRMLVDIDSFSQDFLNIIQRGFLGGGKR